MTISKAIDLNTKSILIVEDDKSICDILKEILIDEGYNVSTAQNGKEALEYLQNNTHPDLILLDVMMPIMDGITFRKAQLNNPQISQIPVIIMSADINIVSKIDSLNNQGFIKKPLEIDDLIKKICFILEK